MNEAPGNQKNFRLPFIAPESYRWFAVFLIWLAHLIYFSIYSSVGVLGPLLKGELGLNNTQFGILCGTIGIGTTAIQVPGGIWCDRLGVRVIMSLAFVLISVCTFFFSLSWVFSLSCLVLLFLGLAVGCSQIAAVKAIIDWFPLRGRATAMGIKQTGVNAGGVAGSLALPFLLGFYDWRVLFQSMSALAFLFALFFLFLYRNTPHSITRSSTGAVLYREALRPFGQIRFLLVTAVGVLLMVVQFSYIAYLVLYLNQSLHYSLGLSGILLASSFAVGAAARVGWGLATDYLFKNREVTLILIGVLGAAACIVLSLLSPATPVWVLYLLSVLSGISLLGWNGVWITLAGEISREASAGLYIGLSFFFANLGLLFGPPLFGFLTDFFHSYFLPWLFLAFCMGMVSLVLLLGGRRSIQKSDVGGGETEMEGAA
jgi:MFS transporter, ACS family, hexuronate transporter